MKGFWYLTIAGSVLGAFVVITGVASASGAPQEAAAAAIGLSLAVIPYCLARAASEINQASRGEPKVDERQDDGWNKPSDE